MECSSRQRGIWVLLVATFACSSISAEGVAPGRELTRTRSATPTTDFNRLSGAFAALPRLHSLLVSHHGQIVYERYFNGRERDDLDNIKSVSKSVVSALVGIAIELGFIAGKGATLHEYFPNYLATDETSQKGNISIENLLTMSAGLRSTSNGNYGAWVTSSDWIRAALNQPFEALPGQAMLYSTGDSHLLSAIITRASNQSTLSFAREHLTRPLGFELAEWPRDPQGIYFGGNDMEMTPRQLLLFAELYLNRGRYNERQVVPSEWIGASLQPKILSPTGEARYYGYGWWICELASFRVPHAWGFGGQFIMLVPDLNVAIVTTSSSAPGPESHTHANRVYQLLQQLIAEIATLPSPG